MEKEDLKWELNELEVEEEVGDLLLRNSKATKEEVTNGKIETNGHSNFPPNGTEKSDLGNEQEKFDLGFEQEKLEDKHNGFDVEEETEKIDIGDEQEKLEDEYNGVEVEEGTKKFDLGPDLGYEQESSEDTCSEDKHNGVEVDEEKGQRKGSPMPKASRIYAGYGGVEEEAEKFDLGDEQEKLEDKHNGVVAEEETEPNEVLVQQLVASNNGVEEGTEAKIANGAEKSDLSDEQEWSEDKYNGFKVEEETEPLEELVQHLVASNNGVKEGTEAKQESKQQLVTLTNGVEEGTAAEEVPTKSGHSVYYDNDEGIWKCRVCTWTLQGKIVGIGRTKNSRGHLHKLVNYPMLDQRGHLFSFGSEGGNFTSKPSIKDQIKRTPGDGAQESAALDIKFNGYLKSDYLSSSSVQPSRALSEDHSIVPKSSSIDEIESADTDLLNDTDVKDFDVENVLQKQNTHDLYCPNCNSCITRRVIVKKRKRRVRISSEDVKRNKSEFVFDSKVGSGRAQATNDRVREGVGSSIDDTPLLAADDYHPDREPEIFRCLSCFSFFIPTGSGFKLFRIFGEKGDKENIKGERTPKTNKNWFYSIFASDKGKASVEQGSSIGANAVKIDAGVRKPSDTLNAKSLVIKEPVPPAYSSSEIAQEAGGNIAVSENQDAKWKGKMTIDTAGKPENGTKSKEGGSIFDMFGGETSNQPNTSASSKEIQGDDRNDEQLRTAGRIHVSNGNLAQDSLPASEQTGLKFQITSTKDESLTLTNDRNDEQLRTAGRTQVSNGNLAPDSLPASQQTGLDFLITSSKDESLTIDFSENDLKSDAAILNKGSDNEPLLSWATAASALNGFDGNGKPKVLTEIPQEHEQHIKVMHLTDSLVESNDDNFQPSSKDGAHSYEFSQHTITKTKFEIHSKQPLKVDEDALISSVKDALSIQDTPVNITNISMEAAANGIAGKDTIIIVEAGHEAAEVASPNLATQINLVERQGTDAAEVKRIEIIKSIIFGGLAESITSLSVVSSAAGGDAATLNVLALGMANLIGGLFIMFHNLWELKRDRYEQASNQIMEKHVDRYRQLLGRRENFILHAVVAVLSYIIFGLVPPIVYGFSFRKTDDRELKLVAVAAASLVCILILATGKAYTQRAPKPYIKTIATYIVLGFMVSGVSWAAGVLFKRLLDKLGLFQSGSTNNLLFSEIPGPGAAWASF